MSIVTKLSGQQIWREPRTMAGIGLIVLSYIACWPLIGILGAIAARMARPNLVLIGGPAVYILSYVFLAAGVLLAGKRYTYILRDLVMGLLRRAITAG